MEKPLSFEATKMREHRTSSEESLYQLTSEMVSGDESAWREFFSQYANRLRAYLTTCLREQPSNRDDVFQDCMIRVSRHIRVFSDEEAFWSWLTVLARSALTDQARRKSAWSRFLDRYTNFTKLSCKQASLGTENLDRALSHLSEQERNLIKDKYENGHTTRDLALKADCSEKAMEHRLARVRAKLAKELRNNRPAS